MREHKRALAITASSMLVFLLGGCVDSDLLTTITPTSATVVGESVVNFTVEKAINVRLTQAEGDYPAQALIAYTLEPSEIVLQVIGSASCAPKIVDVSVDSSWDTSIIVNDLVAPGTICTDDLVTHLFRLIPDRDLTEANLQLLAENTRAWFYSGMSNVSSSNIPENLTDTYPLNIEESIIPLLADSVSCY